MPIPRRTIFLAAGAEKPSNLENEKAMAQPAQKTKNGYTRSVGVQPFQDEWVSGL